jgi:hypothetical protein
MKASTTKQQWARGLRGVSVTYSRSDLAAVALLGAVVSVWAAVAGGSFSLLALLACVAMFAAFYLAGSLVAGVPALAAGLRFDLPLRLLVGYALVNTTLLVLAWVSPLGVVANFALVLAFVAWAFFKTKERREHPAEFAPLALVVLCVVATTLWCQDSIRPTSEQGDVVVYKPWIDGFYHSVHIRIFGASHGASTIEDFRLSGVPARPYHYGMYLMPAVIKQASAIHAYAAFAGILAPVGVLFTGFAAYAFFGSLWGVWPGVAAAAALLLFPDGAQQGMQNPFMSYHWLTQISPSATYGLALLALAWLFVIRGSTQGSRIQLVTGWAVAAVVVLYKLHYVVASALLLLLVPALFFRGEFGSRKRAAWAVSACVVYAVSLIVGQKVPGVPLIRFDGSAVGEILRLVQTFAKPGALKDAVVAHTGTALPWTSNLLYGVPYIAFAAFGLILPVFVTLVVLVRRRAPLLHVLFPLLLIANFLVMFFGLALDFESSTPDELSHRPVMIVYFFVTAFCGGALGLLLAESRRLSPRAAPVILGVATLLLAVPAFFGPGVQRMWAMPRISPVRVPKPLVRVAEHIRTHGGPDDVFQDSQFDRTYTIAALSERRTFVAHTMTSMTYRGEMVGTRSAAIDQFMQLRLPRAIRSRARVFGFRWFVLHQGDKVDWHPDVARHPVLLDGSVALYQF